MMRIGVILTSIGVWLAVVGLWKAWTRPFYIGSGCLCVGIVLMAIDYFSVEEYSGQTDEREEVE